MKIDKTQDVVVRLSAKHRANGRHVWAVGLPLDFSRALKETQQRVSLDVKDEKLVVSLSDTGIKLNLGAAQSKVMWAGQISQAHAHNLTEPRKPMDSHHVKGSWNPKTSTITITGALPDLYREAITNFSAAVHSLESHDTHVDEVQDEIKDYVLSGHDVEAETAQAFQQIEILAHAEEISDEEARNLKARVNFLLSHRPDMKVSLTDAGITFTKTETRTVEI